MFIKNIPIRLRELTVLPFIKIQSKLLLILLEEVVEGLWHTDLMKLSDSCNASNFREHDNFAY